MTVNDTSFNILVSYAHIGKKNSEYLEYIEEQSRLGKMDIMVDSGAFTKWQAELKGSSQCQWINMDNYCKWLDIHKDKYHKYVMLDKVGDDVQSKKNYKEMIARGYNPMYVWTKFDTDIELLQEATGRNPEICVAGGQSKNDYMKKRYQQAYKYTNGKANIHSLAYFKMPDIYQLPILSSDAATWINGPGRFGSMYAYQGNGCIQTITGHNAIMKALKNRNKYLLEQFRESGVSIDELRDSENYKGSRLPLYTACVAFTKVQQYAWRLKKLRMYLSGAITIPTLRSLEYVNKHLKDRSLNYREWLDYSFGKKRVG